MKLDLKSIIILVLLGTTILFGLKWFWSSDGETKEKLNQLKIEYEMLEKQKKEIDLELDSLAKKYKKLENRDKELTEKIDRLTRETEKAKIDSNKSKKELNKLRKELEEALSKIEEVKDNPPNREGDDLLNSLKNKLN